MKWLENEMKKNVVVSMGLGLIGFPRRIRDAVGELRLRIWQEGVDYYEVALAVICVVVAYALFFMPVMAVGFCICGVHDAVFGARPWAMGDSGAFFALWSGYGMFLAGILSRFRRFRALTIRVGLFALALTAALVIMWICALDYVEQDFRIYGYTRANVLRLIYACFLSLFFVATSWPLYFGWSKWCAAMCVFFFVLVCACTSMAIEWNIVDDFPKDW